MAKKRKLANPQPKRSATKRKRAAASTRGGRYSGEFSSAPGLRVIDHATPADVQRFADATPAGWVIWGTIAVLGDYGGSNAKGLRAVKAGARSEIAIPEWTAALFADAVAGNVHDALAQFASELVGKQVAPDAIQRITLNAGPK